MRKRITSLLLTLAMLLSLVPAMGVTASAAGTEIEAVSFSYTGYAEGENVAAAVVTCNTAGVDFTYKWEYSDSGGSYSDATKLSAQFISGIKYTLWIYFKAKDGLALAELNETDVTLEGNNPGVVYTNYTIDEVNYSYGVPFSMSPLGGVTKYIVGFYTQGGKIGDESYRVERVTGTDGKLTAEQVPTPTKEHYTFDGWYTAASGDTVPEPDYRTVRAALTLKTDGTRPILVDKDKYLTVNGEEYVYASDGYGNSIVTDGSMVKVNIDLPVKAKGVEVSGTVTSYGSDSDDVTVTLLQGTSVIGSPQVLTGASGSAPYSQTYSFDTVPAGEYTLKVEKKGHAPFTKEITVSDSNVTEDVTVYLWGDASGDGTTDGWDATLILRADAGISALDPNTAAASDVSGDGVIDGWDATLILRKDAGMISKFPVEEI